VHEKPWGTAERQPTLWFMTQIPHSDRSRPLAAFKADQDEMYYYYEHPKLIGAVSAEIELNYEYPQVLVVTRGENPVLIVRSEQNPLGALFLCSLDARGTYTNWGQISPMSRDEFLKRAAGIVSQIKLIARQIP
jgi:hypothetical protein